MTKIGSVEKIILDFKKDPDYKKLFNNIHDMLMDQFNAETTALDADIFDGVDPVAAKTIQLVSSNYDIGSDLLFSDYSNEYNRMKDS